MDKWTLEEIKKAYEKAYTNSYDFAIWNYLEEELLKLKKPITLEVQNGVIDGKGGLG